MVAKKRVSCEILLQVETGERNLPTQYVDDKDDKYCPNDDPSE